MQSSGRYTSLHPSRGHGECLQQKPHNLLHSRPHVPVPALPRHTDPAASARPQTTPGLLSCRRSLHACRATSSSSLATYPLLEHLATAAPASSRRPRPMAAGSGAWLVACVRNIVQSMSAATSTRHALLELVFSRPAGGTTFQGLPISPAVANDPHSWGAIADSVRASGADGLVLVRPIASPEAHCIYAGSPSSDAAAAEAQACGSACSSAACPPPAQAQGSGVEGQVGECCEHEAAAELHQHHHQQRHRGATRREPGSASSTSSTGSCGSSPTQYWGLVVQGQLASSADGCYVLKTVRSDGAGGCSCTHFSLTRVCAGQPLAEQLRDAWLVPSP